LAEVGLRGGGEILAQGPRRRHGASCRVATTFARYKLSDLLAGEPFLLGAQRSPERLEGCTRCPAPRLRTSLTAPGTPVDGFVYEQMVVVALSQATKAMAGGHPHERCVTHQLVTNLMNAIAPPRPEKPNRFRQLR
jgi:hypothetical protein